MEPTHTKPQLDYAPHEERRRYWRIGRRVVLAALLGFTLIAAIRSIPSLQYRLQAAELYRQAERFSVSVPTTGTTDNPTARLLRHLGHRTEPTVFSGVLQRGETRRLLHVSWLRQADGRHRLNSGVIRDAGRTSSQRFSVTHPQQWSVNDSREEGSAMVIASGVDPSDPAVAVIEIQSDNRRWQFRFTLTDMDTIVHEEQRVATTQPGR